MMVSLLVLTQPWAGIFGLLCVFSLGGGIVFLGLKSVFDNRLSRADYFVLAAGGAWLPLFLGILPAWWLNLAFGIRINFLVFCLVILIISGFLYWRFPKSQSAGDRPLFPTILTRVIPLLALGLILSVSIYLRLGFISGLAAPLYFDSPMHTSIARDLIVDFETSRLPTYSSFVGGYYHLGFHILIAALSQALNLGVKDVILVFGQILLAVIPLPLFFILRQETKMGTPAFFAVLLAGWGWFMPAHAINWGKYPALTSILTFEFVVCCACLVRQAPKHQRWSLLGVLGFSLLVSTFIHTRSLVLVMIALLSQVLALVWYRLPRLVRSFVFFLSISGLLLLGLAIQAKPILRPVFDPYLARGIWMTLLVWLLVPFALKKFPVAAFSAILSILFLLGSLLLSVTRFLPAYEVQTLLDRPFVEMILFFPLAFLGGLGFAGVIKTLKDIDRWQGARQGWLAGLITAALFGAFFVNLTQYNFSPSDCCKLFGEEDAVALAWMDRNIPSEANVLIASSETVVFESDTAEGYAGSDGGIWIPALIRRNVVAAPFQTGFDAEATLAGICQRGVTHIYAGGGKQSFDKKGFVNRPDWYEILLRLPKTQIYRVVGCP
jgi:hypothetical protein